MAQDYTIDPERVQDLTQNEYYKKLQSQLKDKSMASGSDSRHSNSNKVSNDNHDNRVTETKDVQKAQSARQLFATDDKVQIRSFKWTQNENGDYELTSRGDVDPKTNVDLSSDGRRILRLMGHKIDYSSKMDQLQENYMQSLIQSKSSNFFMAKYAQFKMGMFGQLLSLLGVTQDELLKLQKQALQGAEDENLRLMAENIYNLELTELIHGRNKKVRKQRAMYMTVEKQLIEQMGLLGKPDYWSKTRIIEEHITQLQKIKEEFNAERNALIYQYQYATQETYGTRTTRE